MFVCDDWLRQINSPEEGLCSCSYKEYDQILEQLRDRVISLLMNEHGMRRIVFDVCSDLLDTLSEQMHIDNDSNQLRSQDSYLYWKRPDSKPNNHKTPRKHLILLQGAGDCYEGVWSSSAYVNKPFSDVSMIRYITWAQRDESEYFSVAILNPNEHTRKTGGGGLRAQIHVQAGITHLIEQQYRRELPRQQVRLL